MIQCRIALILIALGTGFHSLQSETLVSGTISKDVEWRFENSPYVVTGDIVVERRAVLRIEAGTLIKILPRDTITNRDTTQTPIVQIDESDSQMVAIKVYGGIICVGHEDKRITFVPQQKAGAVSPISWYGMVLERPNEDYTEFAHTDVTGAVYGLTLKGSNIELYRNIFSYNNTGIFCSDKSEPVIRNNTIANNIMAGILVRGSNPSIISNIIAFNRNHAIWGDGVSRIEVTRNCIYGSGDGDLVDCPVPLNRIVRINSKGDSCDKYYNIYKDPVFAGSIADSIAIEKDTETKTDALEMKDTVLAKIETKELAQNEAARARHKEYPKYYLSNYSPCIDAGKPGSKYADEDGTNNDMGVYGGPVNKLD